MLLYFFGSPCLLFCVPVCHPSVKRSTWAVFFYLFVISLPATYTFLSFFLSSFSCYCCLKALFCMIVLVSLLRVLNGCWVFVFQGRNTHIDFVCPFTLTLHVPLLSTVSGPCMAVTTRRCRRWILHLTRLVTLAPRPWARHWGTRPSYCRDVSKICSFLKCRDTEKFHEIASYACFKSLTTLIVWFFFLPVFFCIFP